MSDVLEKLQVVIEGNLSPYKKVLKEAVAETKSKTDAINRETEKLKIPFGGLGDNKELGKIQKVQKAIRDTIAAARKQSGLGMLGSVKNNIGARLNDFQVGAGIKTYTDEYRQLQAGVERSEKALERLNQKQRDLQADGANLKLSEQYQKVSAAAEKAEKALTDLQSRQSAIEASGKGAKPTDNYANLQKQMAAAQGRLSGLNDTKTNWAQMGMAESVIPKSFHAEVKAAEQEVDSLKVRMASLKDSGGAYILTKEMQNLGNKIREAKEKLSQYRAEQQQLEVSGANLGSRSWQNLQAEIGQVKQRIDSANRAMRELKATGNGLKFAGLKNAAAGISDKFGKMKAVFDRVTPAIKRTSGAFGALIQKFASGIPGIKRMTGSMNSVHGSSGRLGGAFQTLAMTARFMFASFLIMGAMNGMKEGFQNLAQYSNSTNDSLSMLMSSLTQLKNSLATAFAPILNVVAPILDALIQKISQAATAIGMLIGFLTGQGTFTRAKKVQQDYAASLGTAAKGADKATKANEKLKASVFGFDQLNKLDDHSESNAEGSGAGDAGGLSPGDMFEDVSISDNIRAFAEKIKEAWANADFTEIGAIVGNKLNAALSSIPWDQIKDTTARIAKSIATFLNGFIETTNWNLIGATLAEAFNTIMLFFGTFIEKFHWQSLGQAIADGINGTVSTVDWAYTAQTLSNGAIGMLEALIAVVQNIDWWQLGESVNLALQNIDWSGIIRRLFELIGSLLGGLGAFIGGLFRDAFTGIGQYFEEKVQECGGDIPRGIWKGINDGLGNILIWIYDNIFVPFIDGFKKAFGINSPSTVMAEQGGYIISGLFQGLLNNIGGVITWFADLPNKVRDALGNAKEWLVEKGQGAIEGIKNGYEAVKDSQFFSNVRRMGSETFSAIGNIAESVRQKGSDIVNGIKNGYENNKGQIQSAVSSMPSLISSGIGNLWNIGRDAISSFANGFGSVHIPMPHIGWNWNNISLGSLSFSVPNFNLSWYAKGGFPGAGEMFIAREAGPELVGKMGNRNAVANNGQIVDGIKFGVKEAMVEAMMLFTGSGNGSGEVPIIELTIICDSETLYRTVERGKEKASRRYEVIQKI